MSYLLMTHTGFAMPQPSPDKLLQRIAEDLSSQEVVFPTSFNITLRVRDLLRDPDISIDKLAKAMETEPIISAKLLRMANSAALAPAGGNQVKDLRAAIMRLGLESVKSTAFAVAMEQLARSKHMSAYTDLSNRVWEHSILVAAIARQLSRHLRRGKPDEAFFAGLVHDIGAFYLLYYAAQDPDFIGQREAILDLMVNWHDGIGHALLDAMGQQSDELLMAVQDHESGEPITQVNGLAEILRAANRLANRTMSWHGGTEVECLLDGVMDQATIEEILETSRADVKELHSSLTL